MQQNWPMPIEIRMVPTEPTPPRLFVCSAKTKYEIGAALERAFREGTDLPKDIQACHNKQLVYDYNLGERGLYWESGPSADFTEILYIFSTNGLEEAQKLLHNSPFYKEGIFYDDGWFEWHIHAPFWRSNIPEVTEGNLYRKFGVLPDYPPEIKPVVKKILVNVVTPPKLFASFARVDMESMQKISQDIESGGPIPVFQIQHFFNRAGAGGMGPMGYDWAGGPSIDHSYDLTILSVNSLQTAQFLRENDALARHGLFYDFRYFEWCIHMPLKKASPAHKEAIKYCLRDAGVNV